VPRLAIVIRAVRGIDSLERTLVSVLENRPSDCEILVALDRPYADPYELKDEVRFIPAAKRSSPVAGVNEAFALTRAPFVHLLSSGCTVTEGWTEAALARFGDRQLASVAPLVMDRERPERIVAAGLGYRASGRRFLVGRGSCDLPLAPSSEMVGACSFAAFYRKAALDLVGGFSAQLGMAQADVDLALSLKHAGLTSALEPQSRVLAADEIDAGEGPFLQALHDERLFWRNLPGKRRGSALVAHAGLVSMELVRSFLRPRMLLELAGRTLACCQIGNYARRHAALVQLGSRGGRPKSAPERVRVDAAHAASAHSQSAGARAHSR